MDAWDMLAGQERMLSTPQDLQPWEAVSRCEEIPSPAWRLQVRRSPRRPSRSTAAGGFPGPHGPRV